MKKLKLKKIISKVLIGMSIFILIPVKSQAQWKQNSTGWWYEEANSYAQGWKLINGYWYYFYPNGYMAENTTINQYYVNANGAWTSNRLTEDEFKRLTNQIVFQLVNEYRQANGVSILKESNDLMITAKGKSQHMADNNYFNHNFNGIDTFSLMKQLYNTDISGENILYTSETFCDTEYTTEGAKNLAYKMFNMWKNSPGHNENMLRSNFKEFGFGIAFGKYNGYNVVFGTQHFRY